MTQKQIHNDQHVRKFKRMEQIIDISVYVCVMLGLLLLFYLSRGASKNTKIILLVCIAGFLWVLKPLVAWLKGRHKKGFGSLLKSTIKEANRSQGIEMPASVRYFHLLMILVAFGIGFALFLGYFIEFKKLQAKLLFPPDVIYGQGGTAGEFLAFFPPVLPFLFLGMLVTQLVVSKIFFARKLAEQKGNYRSSQHFLVKLLAWSLAICVPLAVIGFFNYMYITDSTIFYRNPLLIASSYSWEDVQSIESALSTQRQKSRTYIVLEYQFHMHNGATIKLNPGIYKFFEFYPALYDIIKNHPTITRTSNIMVSKDRVSNQLDLRQADLAFRMAHFQSP